MATVCAGRTDTGVHALDQHLSCSVPRALLEKSSSYTLVKSLNALTDDDIAVLEAGIAAARPGACVGDIGAAVQRVAEAAGFAVVRDMVGHGCGIAMHEGPQVPNYWTEGTLRLRPGMVLCVEPMVNAGTWRITIDRQDKWTVRTADGSLSAHFEHQILITENEAEILTWPRNA